MCFSAQASFLVGTGLTAFGAHLLRSVKKTNEYFFFAIPLLFGIQQLCEGIVWITQGNTVLDHYNILGRYAFIFFAFILWPTWVPFALWKLENNRDRKYYLASILGAGLVVSTMLAWASIALGIQSTISCNHIEYTLALPRAVSIPGTLWYCIIVSAPFFIVQRKYMYEFGLLLIASAAASAYFYTAWFTSVWCFFAALLSLMIAKMKTE